jgi:WD40 repeat protein
MAKIFISYRRDESAGHAGRVQDRLEREFGRDLLFMDVDAIPLGLNFVKILREEVTRCSVLLAVIGPNWLNARDEEGTRRLDNPSDFVRIEVATALRRDIPVIPVLLDGARMPKADQLPEDLQELAQRNALDVRHASFHNDMDKLVKGLKALSGQAEAPPASWVSPEDNRKIGEVEARQHDEDASRNKEAEGKLSARLSDAEPEMGLVRTLAGHGQRIACIAATPDARTLASGCSRVIFDPELWIWDIGGGKVRAKLAGHTTSILSLAFSPDGTILASGATDGGVRLWSVPDSKPLRTLNLPHSVCALKVAFSPDGATVATGTDEPGVRLWRMSDGKLLRILEEHQRGVTGLSFSPDGSLLASVSHDDIVRIWRVTDWESLPLSDRMKQTTLRTVAFSPNGAILAVGAQLWRVGDWELIHTLEADNFDADDVTCVAFSPDSAMLALGGMDPNLWRVADGKFLYRLRRPDADWGISSPSYFTWTSDGSLLVSVEKGIRVWSWLRR